MHTFALEHEGDGVSLVLATKSDCIVVSSALEDFVHRGHVDPKRDVLVTAVVLEPLTLHKQGDQGHV